MSRYFIEVAYKGTAYAGFQVQQNANTVQAEVEKALLIYFRTPVVLTGSSRTDTGVHAAQNYFHFDAAFEISTAVAEKAVYHINAILPGDIVIKSLKQVAENAHCRFDALSRSYQYTIYHLKDPFLADKAWYYPYPLQLELLEDAASALLGYNDFRSFSKKNTQVVNYECRLYESAWTREGNVLVYSVKGNRFLRGMVRGLVATMLLAAKGKYDLKSFCKIVEARDAALTDFSAPGKGLILQRVSFDPGIFRTT